MSSFGEILALLKEADNSGRGVAMVGQGQDMLINGYPVSLAYWGAGSGQTYDPVMTREEKTRQRMSGSAAARLAQDRAREAAGSALLRKANPKFKGTGLTTRDLANVKRMWKGNGEQLHQAYVNASNALFDRGASDAEVYEKGGMDPQTEQSVDYPDQEFYGEMKKSYL